MNEELAIAVSDKNFSEAKRLLEEGGCDVNTLTIMGMVSDKGEPLIHTALANRDQPMFDLLFKHGADLDLTDGATGRTGTELARRLGLDSYLDSEENTPVDVLFTHLTMIDITDNPSDEAADAPLTGAQQTHDN